MASAFTTDRQRLEQGGYTVELEISLPGYVRAVVRRDDGATRVDWAHDSCWRFMPLVRDPLGGLLLHPTDLAINKVLTLAGRDEAGCLYYSTRQQRFVVPRHDQSLAAQGIVPHYGAPGGVVPRVVG